MHMKRRRFLRTSGMASGALLAGPSLLRSCSASDHMQRIGLTTVVFRRRFPRTNPDARGNLLSLEMIPGYFQDRFGIYQPEFWSEHFES